MTRRVAIIGYSFRLPGVDRHGLWDALCSGRNLVSQVDPSRWAKDSFLHPDKQHPGTSYTFRAGSVGDVSGFDAGFFGISPREAACMDPQQRLLLELAWEAMEQAGIPPSQLRGTDCGVYLGISTSDYAYRLADDLAAIDAFTATGNTISIAANRISYLFDLHGPSMAIDTACSSSLVAFHQACSAIAAGETATALAGGISIHLHPYGFLTFSKASMLSPRGRCSAFDAAADGYVRSEGGGLFLLKEYDQALADGDPILAVVAATAVNTDGRKSGLTVPSAASQAALIEKACRQAGLAPLDIDYFEAHGTGTPVGDPIEAKALGTALGQRRPFDLPLPIGSIKSNLGHLEAAAGVAGLVKALLTLQHRLVPATAGITALNPAIDFDRLNLRVVTENLPLRPEGPLHVGVNSFGFGGVNAHVILTNGADNTPAEIVEQPLQELPLVVTARDRNALNAAAQAMADLLEHEPQQLYTIAWNALYRRELHPCRAVLYGSDARQLSRELRDWAAGLSTEALEQGTAMPAPQGPVFVYAGNGSQWEGMGRELLNDPLFRASVTEIDRLFAPAAGFSLLDELAGCNGQDRYTRTELAQPALFALQVGITCMLRSLGIEPVAVIGHSVGEIAAAWACGALSLPDAVRVIHQRSRLQGLTAGMGQMTAAQLGRAEAEELLTGLALSSLALAGCNSPQGVTFAGAEADLELLERALDKQGTRFKRLDLDYAFHSPAMDGIQAELLDVLAPLAPGPAQIPFYSTVTGSTLEGTQLDARYWWRNIREPVQFEQGVGALLATGANLFVSVTPHPILRSYLYESMQTAGVDGTVIVTLQRDQDNPLLIRKTAARALIAGAVPNRTTLFPTPGRAMALPGYPWQREPFWHPVTTESQGLLARQRIHPLLGYQLRQQECTWENHLDTVLLPFLADHAVGGATVYPATGYLELALAAASAVQSGPVELEQLEIRSALLLEQGKSRLIRVVLAADTGQLTIRGRELLSDSPFTTHAVVRVVPSPRTTADPPQSFSVPKRTPDFDADSHQQLTLQAGLLYGPAFQAIEHGWVEGPRAIARLRTPACLQDGLAAYHLHPAFLDNALQLVFQIVKAEAAVHDGLTYLPVAMERVRYRPGCGAPCFIAATLTGRSPHSLTADVAVYDAQGRPIAEVRQVRFRRARLQRQPGHAVRYLGCHRIPGPLPGKPARLPEGLARQVAEGVASLVGATRADQPLTAFVNELEPLLETLCCSFVTEALQAAEANGLFLRDPAGQPWLTSLIQLAEANGLLEMVGDQPVFSVPPEGLTASLLWQSLIHQYPDQAALIHDVGRAGLHLARRLQGQPCPAADQSPETLLLPRVLGAGGRQGVAAMLKQLAIELQDSLPSGERLRLLELSHGEPLWLEPFCSGLATEYSEYHVASCSSAAREWAEQQREQHPGIVTHDPDELPAALAGAVQLAVINADFADGRQAGQSLQAAQQALAPGGYLLLVGLHPLNWADLLGEGRQLWQQPLAGWIGLLQHYGFSDISSHQLTDAPAAGPWLISAVRGDDLRTDPAHPVTQHSTLLLAGTDQALATPLAVRLIEAAQAQGVGCSELRLDQADCLVEEITQHAAAEQSLQGILFLTGLSHRLYDAATYPAQLVDSCMAAAQLALAAEQLQLQLPLWLVTTAGAADADGCPLVTADLASIDDAPFWAFGRTMKNEYPGVDLRLVCLEEGATDQALQALLDECRQGDGEQEVILSATGARFLPRLVLESPPQQRRQKPYDPAQTTLRLGFALPGQLRNLRWEQHPRSLPQTDQVEVEVHATGLNFRDIMYTLGLLSDEAVENGFAGATLGLEFSGIVSRVGEQVSGFRPGDRVVGFGPAGFSTRAVTTTAALSPIPAGLSFEAAATIPATFFTVWYALCYQARLQPGEKVLIHGAAGGIGLAAIQIAQHCGAEVYATAGSEAKQDFLRLLGITHIYDSRSLDFADQILLDTDGGGVDVVLNSLAGEAINRNLRVLKPFGRFLELGKRDFYENTQIGLRPFRNNISYFGIDADQVMQLQPDLTRRLFGEIMALFEAGQLHPLPFTCFEAGQVVDAFRYMQQARQIGKVVVTYRNGISHPHSPPEPPHQLTLAPDRSWLVTGGLDGFGLRTAQWLVEKGVRNLALISRRGSATPEAQAAVSALQQQGVTVHAAACDVTDRAALATLLQELQQQLPPLAGVVHAATVIEDGLLRSMDSGQLQRVLAPKILGARYLHELTADGQLDFFVLFSSATTLFGNPGQGNYVAANSWLEGLARLRRSQGQPATVVRWGAIDDVGFLARNQQIKESLTGRMGGSPLHSDTALAILEQLLLHDCSGLGVLELDWAALRRFLPSAGHGRFRQLSSLYAPEATVEEQLDLQRLAGELGDDELFELVAGLLSQEVGQILRLQPDRIATDRSLYDLGLDSLMGVELVTALEARFGIVLPVMALTEGPTIEKLAGRVISHLRGGQQPDQVSTMQSQVEQLACQHVVDLPERQLQELAAELGNRPSEAQRMID